MQAFSGTLRRSLIYLFFSLSPTSGVVSIAKVCMDEAPRTVFLLDAAGNSLADTDFRRLFVHFSRGAMYMIYT
jgi:hypothetical protein